MDGDKRVPVRDEADIVAARQTGRAVAAPLGFSEVDLTLIATAISEIARNMVEYGKGGEFLFEVVKNGTRSGVKVVAKDQGPGIPDLEKAMQDGFTTGKGLGLGLPGAKRLMDDFQVESRVGAGTTVTMIKWKR